MQTEVPVARRGRVRTRDWVRVSRGIYRPSSAGPALLADLQGWQLTLPAGGCLTHLSAALVRGWAVPPLPPDLPTFASIGEHHPRPRRPGLVVSRHPRAIGYDEVCGLRVARPPEILLAAARDLGLLDLVLLVDSALHRGACTPAELCRVAAPRRRGAPGLRRALDYADGRAESPWETVLRMFHVLSEVPVEPQYVIVADAALGRPGGNHSGPPSSSGSYRADLRILGTRRLAEYDGEVHRSRERHALDLARERALQRLGWQRYGYTSGVLLRQGLSVLRDADDALGRPHEPQRIRAWHAALSDSLFTAAGTARLRARWAGRGDL